MNLSLLHWFGLINFGAREGSRPEVIKLKLSLSGLGHEREKN